MKYRSFIAVNLPDDVKEKLGRILVKFRETNSNIKWVEPKNLHLTLHFLGNLDEEKLRKVAEILANVTGSYKSFWLKIDKFGCFPNEIRPNIFFLNCEEEGGNTLADLQNQLSHELARLGIRIDFRPWKAHITFGRLKTPRRIRIADSGLKNLKFRVKSIDLMKSNLTPRGPIYNILKSFPLCPSL